ncbi:MAG: hypothetical protein AAB364_01100 [Patescibacteria group bacterium]|mgnify:CR=1
MAARQQIFDSRVQLKSRDGQEITGHALWCAGQEAQTRTFFLVTEKDIPGLIGFCEPICSGGKKCLVPRCPQCDYQAFLQFLTSTGLQVIAHSPSRSN